MCVAFDLVISLLVIYSAKLPPAVHKDLCKDAQCSSICNRDDMEKTPSAQQYKGMVEASVTRLRGVLLSNKLQLRLPIWGDGHVY